MRDRPHHPGRPEHAEPGVDGAVRGLRQGIRAPRSPPRGPARRSSRLPPASSAPVPAPHLRRDAGRALGGFDPRSAPGRRAGAARTSTCSCACCSPAMRSSYEPEGHDRTVIRTRTASSAARSSVWRRAHRDDRQAGARRSAVRDRAGRLPPALRHLRDPASRKNVRKGPDIRGSSTGSNGPGWSSARSPT